tara:strand:+ start:389 stop:583 length:195 start_codon:yes stop_codon:yes gene_type:complete
MLIDEVLIPCGICNKEYEHQEVCGGFESFTKEELKDMGLTKILNKYRNILENGECICNDCLSNF